MARRTKTGISYEWNGDEVKRRAEKAAAMSSFEVGLIVEGQAKLLCPVAEKNGGRLRSSITTASGTGQRTKPKGAEAVGTDLIARPDELKETHVGTPVFYGPYQEYGTVRASAQPFLRPALDMIKGRRLTVTETVAKNGRVRQEFGEYLTTNSLFNQTNEAFTE